MSDSNNGGWLAFVSDSGRVIGVGRHEGEDFRAKDAVALAILAAPVTLRDWMTILSRFRDAEEAVDAALKQYGGERIERVIDLQRATVLHENIYQPIAEA